MMLLRGGGWGGAILERNEYVSGMGENASKNDELKIKWNRKNPMISSDERRILNSHLCLEIRVKEVLYIPQMKN